MSTYVTDTPVFRPTKEEFSKPFCEYMKQLLKKHPDIPMFKVIPPEGWRPRRTPFPKLQKLDIQCPIKQMVFGTRGSYRCILVEQKPLTAYEFRDVAEEEGRLPPNKERDKEDKLLERAFWSSVTFNPPLYGADTPMSFFDEKLPYGWNLRDLGDLLKQPHIPQVPGVTTPMTYFGMWKSFFAWHVEDADLFSINYLHFGAPKVWYCVSPSYRGKFERMAESLFPELHQNCHAFMRHKDILLSPSLLRTYGIEYMQAKQEPNEFIVLNAGAYHSGYNLGFNCAEAVNFATQEWIDVGRGVQRCKCPAMADGVRISMRLFGCSSGSSGSSSDDEDEEEATESDADSAEVDSSASQEQSEEEEDRNEGVDTAAGRVRRKTISKAGDAAGSRKRVAAAGIAGSATKKRKPDVPAVGSPALSPKGPRQTKTALAAAASAAKMRRTHATAEARARLAVAHGRVTKRGSGKDEGHNPGSSKHGKSTAGKARAEKRAKPVRVFNKDTDTLTESLQRAAAAAAAIRARAEAEAAAAKAAKELQKQPQQPQQQQQHSKQQQQQLDELQEAVDVKQEPAGTVLTRRRSSGTNIPAAAADGSAPDSPKAHKANMLASSRGVLSSDVPGAKGQAGGGQPGGEAPQVIIGEDHGHKYFYMVQVLKDLKPKQRGRLVMRWLKEGKDGLFRPSSDTWEEVPGALVGVRTQWVAGARGKAGGYRLLTLRSRILDTELVE